MKYDHSVFFDTVCMIDRVWGVRTCNTRDLQHTLLAASLLALKLSYDHATVPFDSFEAHAVHLARNQIDFSDIEKAELKVLADLRGIVGVPTPYSFLDIIGKSLPLQSQQLAHLFLQMSAWDIDLYYGNHPVVIAIAACVLALYRTHPPNWASHCRQLLKVLAECVRDKSGDVVEILAGTRKSIHALRGLWCKAFGEWRSRPTATPRSYLETILLKFVEVLKLESMGMGLAPPKLTRLCHVLKKVCYTRSVEGKMLHASILAQMAGGRQA